MDITNTTSTNIKTPEVESETPTRIQPPKPIYTNGLLKRHHHPLIQQQPHPPPQSQPVYVYIECLKNHAAGIGGHALDGCGEFMASSISNPNDPTSLKCAACGCHRNFHRRETEHYQNQIQNQNRNRPIVEYHSPNRHQPPPPPPPPPQADSPNSPSPPPISSSYYPASAPHMLLALSSAPHPVAHHTATLVPHSNGRKRFRTKFTHHQKEKMLEFAEKVGWKIQKRDEADIASFCNEIGVERGVLKVWMHNNKSTLGKTTDNNNKKSGNTENSSSSGSEDKMEEEDNKNHYRNAAVNDAAAANGNHGSSTSS